MRFAPTERLTGALTFSSIWRKRQVGVNSSEKAPSLMRTYTTSVVSDLDRPFCHPRCMVSPTVTPMHHPMSMGSCAVTSGGGLAVGGCRNPEQGLETAWVRFGSGTSSARCATPPGRPARRACALRPPRTARRRGVNCEPSGTEAARSYHALEETYRQREIVFAAVMAGLAEQEAATRRQRQLAVAADAEPRRRHPGQYFAPLWSAEPGPAPGAQPAELTMTAGGRPRRWAIGPGRGAPDLRRSA